MPRSRDDGQQQPVEEQGLDAAIAAQLEAMSPEQRERLLKQAVIAKAKRRAVQVEVDGKKRTTSLYKLMRRMARERRKYESGAMDETVRMTPRWQLQQATPARLLRRGATKQQLRHWEEAELELDRFGQGAVTSPRPVLGRALDGGRRDFAWGIYARTSEVERVLKRGWAGRDQAAAVTNPALYLDLLQRANQVQLTLAALTARPLPLAATRDALAQRLEDSMRRLSGGAAAADGSGSGSSGSGDAGASGGAASSAGASLTPADKAELQRFISKFSEESGAGEGWVDGKGQVKAGTHFLFTATPKGELLAEAITPGPLKDRRTAYIGVARSPLVTASFFDVFLGPQPLDERGRLDVGYGLTWAANGYRFRPWEAKPDQYIAEERPDGRLAFPAPGPERVERLRLPLGPSVFQLLDEQTAPLRRMLLGGIQESLRPATD